MASTGSILQRRSRLWAEAIAARSKAASASSCFHLLKWQAQPALRGASWRKTLRTQRREIRKLPKQSPTLRRHVPALIRDAYGDAAKDAVDETGLPAQNSERLSVHAGAVLDEENLPDATF
jgi:hypothetical protein